MAKIDYANLDEINILRTDNAYKVRRFTEYHFRINDRLDVFPIKCRWHDIKLNTRGDYERGKLYKILNQIFT